MRSPQRIAPQLAELSEPFSHVFGPSTTFGKDLMPRVAALLDAPQVSDVMEIQSATRFRRPIYAGNAITTVEVAGGADRRHDPHCVVRSRGRRRKRRASKRPRPGPRLPAHTRFVSLAAAGSDRPDLQSAARVISGGRALASSDAFKIIYSLADKLGAAVGASRAAVDAGYVPSDMQVGQTGKIIAPELYIAIGISGAIQHLTGIKDARTIVAINKDGEAPIFEVADIGMVGDLFTIVPELEKLIDASQEVASTASQRMYSAVDTLNSFGASISTSVATPSFTTMREALATRAHAETAAIHLEPERLARSRRCRRPA